MRRGAGTTGVGSGIRHDPPSHVVLVLRLRRLAGCARRWAKILLTTQLGFFSFYYCYVEQ